jgi:hypothetical protein
MEKVFNTLKEIIALSGAIDPSLEHLSEKSGAFKFDLCDRGKNLVISSLINDSKSLLEANIYLSTLGLHPYRFVGKTPEEQSFLTSGEAKIEIDLDLMKHNGNYPNPANLGRGLVATSELLEKFISKPEKLKDYYYTMQKFNKLIGADLTDIIPKTAELRLIENKPHIELDFMDGWFELTRLMNDHSNPNLSITDSSESLDKNPEIKRELKKLGLSENELKQITFTGFSNDLFYKKFVDKIFEITEDRSKFVVHASFAWNENSTPSVLQVPLSDIVKSTKTINAVLDKFINLKGLLASPRGDFPPRN